MKGKKIVFPTANTFHHGKFNYATNLIDLTSNKKSHAHHEHLY